MSLHDVFVFAQTTDLFARLSSTCERHHVRVLPWSPNERDAQLLFVECREAEGDPGLALLARLRPLRQPVRIVVTASGSESLAVEALRLGAADYVRLNELSDRMTEIVGGRAAAAAIAQSAAPGDGCSSAGGILGDSVIMQRVRECVERSANTPSSVLITGETGTGKEIVAQAIHRESARRQHAFVCLNCAALPEPLAESELFGYERGAFTGATAARVGRMRRAHLGTMFLDEVGDMSLAIQAKVLRAIETREISPLGTERSVPVDVRIIAATHQDLEQRVAEKAFRQDLFFRLNVVRIRLPPLRERRDDIPQLAAAFVPPLNALFGLSVTGLTAAAIDCLCAYDWPGNVRELRNVLEVAFLNRPAAQITVDDLPAEVRADAPRREPSSTERQTILSALLQCEWNVSAAARRLHWSRMTVYRKLAKYQLSRTPADDRAGIGAP